MKSFFFFLAFLCYSGTLIAQDGGIDTDARSFKIPISIQIANVKDTLFFGVNPGNTVGIDDNLSLGEFVEAQAPPLPPGVYPYDGRFVTLPGREPQYPAGLGTGTFTDYRPYIGPAQVDSFLLYIRGTLCDQNEITLSWPGNLADYSNTWIIKPIIGDFFPATDMTTSRSVVVPTTLPIKQIYIIKTGLLVNVEKVEDVHPTGFALQQNFPNPFNPATRITWDVGAPGDVTLTVHDVLGNRIRTLASGRMETGRYTLQFDASALPSGIYLYRLSSGNTTITKKMQLLR